MNDEGKRNLRLGPEISEKLDNYIDEAAKKGARLKPSQVVCGALVLFFELSTDAQFDVISRGRNLDLEKARSGKMVALQGGLKKVMGTENKARSRKPPSPKRRRVN